MKHIRVLIRFIRKNMNTVNTGNPAEAVIQYKKTKDARAQIGMVYLNNLLREYQTKNCDHKLSIWAGFLDKIASFSFSDKLSKLFTQFTASTISIGQG